MDMADELNWDSLSRKPEEARRAEPEPPSGLRKMLAPLLGGLAATFKFAAPVLKFLPLVLKTGGSMLLSIGAYAWLYGWKFGLGFVLLLLVLDMGTGIFRLTRENSRLGKPHHTCERRFGIDHFYRTYGKGDK